MIKKMYKRAKKALKKRYVAKSGGRRATGGIRVAKMAKDIMYLKSVLNPEKKRFEANEVTGKRVGQINATNPAGTLIVEDGSYFADCTPIPAQGVTSTTRNGASIKLHSSMWHFQFMQETTAVSEVRLTLEIYSIKGEPYTGFNFPKERFLENPFVRDSAGTQLSVRDRNSQINPDNYMKGKVIARRQIVVKPDAFNGVKNIVDLKLPISYNKGKGHHIRFAKDSIDLESGQLYILIRSDRGNVGTVSAVGTQGVPDVGLNTGVNMYWNRIDYFYDN